MYPDVPSFDRTKQPLTGATKARADARERKRARLRDEALDALGPAAEFVRSKAAAARGGAVGAIAARAAEKERKAAARAEMLANRPWEDKDDGDRKHLFVTYVNISRTPPHAWPDSINDRCVWVVTPGSARSSRTACA